MVKQTSRKQKPKLSRVLKNTNRIVRVYHNRTNSMLQQVSDNLGCPYQLAFDEYLEFASEQLNLSVAALREIVEARLLDKYTGSE